MTGSWERLWPNQEHSLNGFALGPWFQQWWPKRETPLCNVSICYGWGVFNLRDGFFSPTLADPPVKLGAPDAVLLESHFHFRYPLR